MSPAEVSAGDFLIQKPPVSRNIFITWWFRYATRFRSWLLNHQIWNVIIPSSYLAGNKPMTRKLRVFLCHVSQDKPAVRESYE